MASTRSSNVAIGVATNKISFCSVDFMQSQVGVVRVLHLAAFAGAGVIVLSGGIAVGLLTALSNLPEDTLTNPDRNAASAIAAVALFSCLGFCYC